MKISNINKRKYMTDEHYIKQPIQLFELDLNMIIYKTPYLINVLDRSLNHHLLRKNSYVPNS